MPTEISSFPPPGVYFVLPARVELAALFCTCFTTTMGRIFLSFFLCSPCPHPQRKGGTGVKVSGERGRNLNWAVLCRVAQCRGSLQPRLKGGLWSGLWHCLGAQRAVLREGWGCGRRFPAQAVPVLGLCKVCQQGGQWGCWEVSVSPLVPSES